MTDSLTQSLDSEASPPTPPAPAIAPQEPASVSSSAAAPAADDMDHPSSSPAINTPADSASPVSNGPPAAPAAKLSGIMADSTSLPRPAVPENAAGSGFDPAPQRPVAIRIRHLPEFTTTDQAKFMLQFCGDDVIDVETQPADPTSHDAGLATAHVTVRSRHVADEVLRSLDGKMNIRGTATLIVEVASASNTPTQAAGRLRGRVSPSSTALPITMNTALAAAAASGAAGPSSAAASASGYSPGPMAPPAPAYGSSSTPGSVSGNPRNAAGGSEARYAFGTLPTGSEITRQTGKDLIGGSEANHDDDNELLSIPFNGSSTSNGFVNGAGFFNGTPLTTLGPGGATITSGAPPPGAIPIFPTLGAGALPPMNSQRRATVAHIPMLNALAGLTPLNTTNLGQVNGSMLFHPVTGPASAISPIVGNNILSPLSTVGGIHGPFTAGPTPGPSFRRGSNFPSANPADQNPPCNTLYVGNLPAGTTEDELKEVFTPVKGYKRLCYRVKANGPMCFVEFEDIQHATKCLNDMYGYLLPRSNKHGIRLSFSKNPLGVRSVPAASMANNTLPAMAGSSHAVPAFPNASGPPPGLSMPPGLALNTRTVSSSSGGGGASSAGTATAGAVNINTSLASEMSLLSTSASAVSAGGASSSASSSASPSVPAYYPASASTITANPWNTGGSVFSGSAHMFDSMSATRGFSAFHAMPILEQAPDSAGPTASAPAAAAPSQAQAGAGLFSSHMMGH
ncbi:uncharacterized protein BROUX77_004968 [Berkeleyomyces rouxiae]|uniref:uncharacterized protein n=1 Tax=Berkeleyomyces rouxiae TaxID=2035830 RepID=UPI003B7693A6